MSLHKLNLTVLSISFSLNSILILLAGMKFLLSEGSRRNSLLTDFISSSGSAFFLYGYRNIPNNTHSLNETPRVMCLCPFGGVVIIL